MELYASDCSLEVSPLSVPTQFEQKSWSKFRSRRAAPALLGVSWRLSIPTWRRALSRPRSTEVVPRRQSAHRKPPLGGARQEMKIPALWGAGIKGQDPLKTDL